MGWKYIYAKGVPIEAQYLYKKAMEMFSIGEDRKCTEISQTDTGDRSLLFKGTL